MTEFQNRLCNYLRAGYPILYIVTPEEDRAIQQITGAVEEMGRQFNRSERRVFVWSVARGLCDKDMNPVDRALADPARILHNILHERMEPAVYILEDFHFFQDERSHTAPLIVRQTRDLAGPFRASRRTVIMLSPVLRIPPELEKEVTVLDLEMPNDAELLNVLEETITRISTNPRVEVRLQKGDRERIVKALSGLTVVEAENALAKVIVMRARLDPEDIEELLSEKEQIIRKSGMLEFYSTPERFGSIGGLQNLKAWLRERERAFSEAARAFGLPYPRGLLLAGVPGCGKSLSAKAVAAEWKMPLLRFDLGKVFASKVGEAEENMRKALKTAETVAPCILWIDEIEKGLAGVRGQNLDGGVTQRLFGTLLTWMEENEKPVFIIATANDIESLPTELLRKGRFNEIFFVDLPTPQERATILAIHLAKSGRDPNDYNLADHALTSAGFSGAELEQAVIGALYKAFAMSDAARLEDHHIAAAIHETKPLSESMRPQIEMIRKDSRWRPASPPAGAEAPVPQHEKMPKREFHRVFEV